MSIITWLKDFKAARVARVAKLLDDTKFSLYNNIAPELKEAKNPMEVVLTSEQINRIKAAFPSDALALICEKKLANIPKEKGFKEIFCNFFGMNGNWSLGRNLLGGLMVHCPEYPTYFIPAYTQAKAKGEATDLKKGEGPRGIITGGLEGIAVGALVSGGKLKLGEMIPYIVLGAGLQYFSSKVFPWAGEKAGAYVYNKRMKEKSGELSKIDVMNQKTTSPEVNGKPNTVKPKFTAKNPYNNFSSAKFKI